MAATTPSPRPDEVIDQLLRDQDYLLSKEIKQRVADLNQLFMQAQHQHLKVEVRTSQFDTMDGGSVAFIDVKLFKQL